ncbi:pancreatic triacylglycerol lipase-like [Anopheles maculipalpis]|uniref:pancreatic triacylglycerol lipase-like n=1 Tax=Anopheles maculipalpis TaxID=1496333 RepID=UPI002159A73C|nr:pancreatic triacylglycerol lipase-like [Anopheles maculipalpis]
MDFVSRLVRYGFVVLFALAIESSADLNYDKELQEVKMYFVSPALQDEMEAESFVPYQEFDVRKELKVLIHGWISDRTNNSITPVRTAYLAQDAHNLLVVDWSTISFLSYGTARDLVLPVANIVGNSLANFIQRLGIELSQVHVIGHSLGAHIAGNVGRHFGGQLRRVTALDPAKPKFKPESNDAVGPDVAQFVDVIHTDGLTLGEDIVRGHVDFFPNGGIAPQPGCEVLDIITLHGCSHFRAPAFFAESIQLPNNFIACACSREEIYRKDEICLPDARETSLRECVAMGESLDPGVRGTFYVHTASAPPYGLGYNTKSEPSI